MKHYTYKISFQSGHFYFGFRSCESSIEDDFNYLGTPTTYKEYWISNICCKTIIKEFDTRREANAFENILILWSWSINKDLSLNAHDGSNQLGTLNRKRKKEEVLSNIDSTARFFTVVDPDGNLVEDFNLSRFCRERNLDRQNLSAVIRGEALHHRGWTANLSSHALYKKAYVLRGITKRTDRDYWQVFNYVKGDSFYKCFKTEKAAIDYRDSLEEEGFTFNVTIKDWKSLV